MLRFTIRDVLWLMVVASLGAAWYVDHRCLAPDAELQRYHAARAKLAIQELIDRRDKLQQPVTRPAAAGNSDRN